MIRPTVLAVGLLTLTGSAAAQTARPSDRALARAGTIELDMQDP